MNVLYHLNERRCLCLDTLVDPDEVVHKLYGS